MTKVLLLSIDSNYLAPKFIGDQDYHISAKIDISKMITVLKNNNIEVEQVDIKNIDYSRNYHGYYVVYPSSEKRGLFYKGYLEDVLLRLLSDGAILIPRFDLFRAHSNKAYQELLRTTFKDERLRRPWSRIIGRLKDLEKQVFEEYPYVVKSAAGAGSTGVVLAENYKELYAAAKRLSTVTYMDYYYTWKRDFFYIPFVWRMKVWLYKKMGRSQSLLHPKHVENDNKIIVQKYIKGLCSDYKVLYYGGKFFVLKRDNRDDDFRASGSGKFEFPTDIDGIKSILDFAELCANEINAPMISMDIGRNDDDCHLIEFQCLEFGPYTIQFSKWHFEKNDDKWVKVMGSVNMEEETAMAIVKYINMLENAEKGQ